MHTTLTVLAATLLLAVNEQPQPSGRSRRTLLTVRRAAPYHPGACA